MSPGPGGRIPLVRLEGHRLILWLLPWLLLWLSAAPTAAELTPQELRGKAIYLTGERPSGVEITAVIGEPGTEVPASVMPCGGCHGRDGRGRPEAGVYPSNLTWAALTKSYGVEHPSGRRHPPYQERLFKRAITMGIDPAGNRLHVAMPRYRLSLADAEDLVAYVKRLGEDPDPGVSDDALTIATLVPKEGPAASLGAAIEAVLRATFDDVNRAGGIYHRSVELRVEPAPREAGARAAALRRLLETGEVFALAGAFLPGAEREMTALAEEFETPLVGPFTLYPQIDFFAPNRYVFYLLAGLEDLARALVGFAAGDEGSAVSSGRRPRAAILADPVFETTALAIAERAAELGWPAVQRVVAGPGELDLEAIAGSSDAVFLLLSGPRQAAFFERAAALDYYPRVLLPGALAGRGVFAVPSGFAGRIFAAFPTSPSNQDPRSVSEYRQLAERYDLPSEHVTAQIATLASARVLIEGLKRAGREVSRARLIEVLEGLVEFDTGLTPPVTYSPNRRVGVRGAYVLGVDLERRTLVPASGFVEAR